MRNVLIAMVRGVLLAQLQPEIVVRLPLVYKRQQLAYNQRQHQQQLAYKQHLERLAHKQHLERLEPRHLQLRQPVVVAKRQQRRAKPLAMILFLLGSL